MAKSLRFQYVAKDQEGSVRTGALIADSEAGAARRLRALGLVPLSIAGGEAKTAIKIGPAKKVKPKHLATFNRQLSTMLAAGLPLTRSLQAIAEQTDHPELKKYSTLVQGEVESGVALSSAMRNYPKVFPHLMVTMIAAGEAGGGLSESLDQVATMYEKSAKLRSKITSALFYPIVVLGLAGVLITGMLLFIVPIFAGVFEGMGAELPLPTKLLMTMAAFIKVGLLPTIVLAVVARIIWKKKFGGSTVIKAKTDPLKLKLPILGKFTQEIVLARVNRTLASLLGTGVPLLGALEIASDTAGNLVYSAALDDIREGVRTGQSLSQGINRADVFPPLMKQMVSTGEESGALPDLLAKVADFYDESVSTRSETITSVIEPLMLVFLGALVGAMVISLYLPMFSVFEHIG